MNLANTINIEKHIERFERLSDRDAERLDRLYVIRDETEAAWPHLWNPTIRKPDDWDDASQIAYDRLTAQIAGLEQRIEARLLSTANANLKNIMAAKEASHLLPAAELTLLFRRLSRAIVNYVPTKERQRVRQALDDTMAEFGAQYPAVAAAINEMNSPVAGVLEAGHD